MHGRQRCRPSFLLGCRTKVRHTTLGEPAPSMFEPNDRLTRALRFVLLVLAIIALAAVVWMVVSKILLVAIVLIGAGFFAYLIYPVIAWLERRRWPRWLAITTGFPLLAPRSER